MKVTTPTSTTGSLNCSRPAGAGFTLLELILVMALIGLFMVVSMPALRDALIDDPLSGSGRRLIGYLGGVRELAVRERQGCLLEVDLEGGVIRHRKEQELQEEFDGDTDRADFRLPGEVRFTGFWQAGDGQSAQGVREIWVTRDGYLLRTVLQLEDSEGEALSLVLYPFLPQIELLDGRYEPQADKR